MGTIQITKVCEDSACKNLPYEIKVGNKTHTFCCEKGFEKSLNDFKEFINSKK